MNDQELIDRFTSVGRFTRDGKRAPQKPLLLLIALARLQRGEERLVPYEEVKATLEPLLSWLWSPQRAHARYPFWHLRTDRLWDVPDEKALLEAISHLRSQKSIPDRVLVREGAQGGLPFPIDAYLRTRPQLVNQLVERLLHDQFPPSLHEDILDRIGMPWVTDPAPTQSPRRRRDPRFREVVLRAYGRRCAICGYDGRLGTTELGLEAAHIMWHAAGGPDEVQNGLALCSFHHKAFDLGALALGDDLQVKVSSDVNGASRVEDLLLCHEGRRIEGPRETSDEPDRRFLRWHLREVFKEPRPS